MSAPGRDEAGASLVMVLVFMAFVGLGVLALLGLTDTGLRASRTYTDAAQQRASVEGAVDAAINLVGSGQKCDGDWTSPEIGGIAHVVRCVGATNPSGVLAAAVQAVGRSGDEDAVAVSGPGLVVLGDVFANGPVTAGAGQQVTVDGAVASPDDCQGAVASADTINCADSLPAGPVMRAPESDLSTGVLPPPRDVPACPTAGAWLATLEPGYYDADDLPALNALTNGGCGNVVVWLKPGTYYFDLDFGAVATGLWSVNDASVTIVGGTPHEWDPAAVAKPLLPARGACGLDEPGLQVMMGGGSRLSVDAGRAELCGSGLHPAVRGIDPARGIHTLAPAGVLTSAGFANVNRVLAIGENPGPAIATAPLVAGATGTIQVTGFAPDLPTGAILTDVQLLVAHHEEGAGLVALVRANFPGLSATGTCALDAFGNGTLASSATPVTDAVNLSACGLTGPDQLAGLRATFSATAGPAAAKERLDGVVVRVRYLLPTTFQAVSAASPIGGGAAFANAGEGRWVDGTVARATAAGSIQLRGFGQPALPADAVVSTVSLVVTHSESGDADDMQAIFSAADGSAPCGTKVVPKRSGLGQTRVDLTGCLGSADALNGLTITLSSTMTGPTGTTDLDGVWLQVQAARPTGELVPTAASSSDFTDAAGALAAAGAAAQTSVATGATSRLVVSGFDTANVPDEAELGTAELHVGHQEAPSGGPSTVVPAVTVVGPHFPQPCTQNLPVSTTGTTDVIDLVTACDLTDPNQLVGVVVTYSLAASQPASGELDVIVLVTDQNGSAVTQPATSANGSGEAPFADPDSALVIDGVSAGVSLPTTDATALTTASLALSGFAATAGADTLLRQAVLDVVHSEDSADLTATVRLSGPNYNGACATAPVPLPQNLSGLESTPVDLRQLCGLASGAQLPGLTAVFGVETTAGAAASAHVDGLRLRLAWTPATTAQAGQTSASGFSPANSAIIADGASAMANLASTPTASLTLSDFTAPPPGSVVQSAQVRVTHAESGDAAVSLHVQAPEALAGCDLTVPVPVRASVGTDVVDVPCVFTGVEELDGLQVTLNAVGTTGTATVDAIVLDLSLRSPRIEALHGCSVATGAGGCALLGTTDAGSTDVVVHGAVHAPTARVDLSLHDLDGSVVTGGLVARAARLDLTPAATFHGALLGPDLNADGVIFTAYEGTFSLPGSTSVETAPDHTEFSLTGWTGSTPSGADSTVVLRIAHREEGPVGELRVTLDLPSDASGPAFSCELLVPAHPDAGTAVVDQFDLTSLAVAQPCGLPAGRDLSGLDVTYTAEGLAGASATLEAVQLDLLDSPQLAATVAYTGSAPLIKAWRKP